MILLLWLYAFSIEVVSPMNFTARRSPVYSVCLYAFCHGKYFLILVLVVYVIVALRLAHGMSPQHKLLKILNGVLMTVRDDNGY